MPLALKSKIRIISNLDDYCRQLKNALNLSVFIFETPQWLEECPLQPIPPVDMKAVCIGDNARPWQLCWTNSALDDEMGIISDDQIGPVYIEVDKYFENEYR